MIARDEERWLPGALASARPWVDEIVLVDTGSRDRTLEIARQFGARVCEHPWQRDFALHRNQALREAQGQWVLVLDADEELDQANAPTLRPTLKHASLQGADALMIEILHLHADGGHGQQIVPRIFRNQAGLRYEGRIHERLVGGNGQALRAPFRLLHHGFAQPPPVMAAKARRNLRLIQAWATEEPGNPAPLAYLAQTLMADPATAGQALEAGRQALDLAVAQGWPRGQWPRIYHPLLTALTVLERRDELVRLALECLQRAPDYPDPLYSLTWAYLQDQRWGDVCQAARRFLACQEHWQKHPLEYPYTDNLSAHLLTPVLERWLLAACHLGDRQQAEQAFGRLLVRDGSERRAGSLLQGLRQAGLGRMADYLAGQSPLPRQPGT